MQYTYNVNQINVTHPKPEVELRLTFSSVLAISSAKIKANAKGYNLRMHCFMDE